MANLLLLFVQKELSAARLFCLLPYSATSSRDESPVTLRIIKVTTPIICRRAFSGRATPLIRYKQQARREEKREEKTAICMAVLIVVLLFNERRITDYDPPR